MPRTGFVAPSAQVDHPDRVGIVKRDVGDAFRGIHGDRVRRGAVGRFAFAGYSDRQPKVDRPHHLVGGRVDHRDGVAIGIRDQQGSPVQRHPSRVQTGRDGSGDRHRGQINHRNGPGDRGAHHRVGDDFSAGGVDLEVRPRSGPATLVADVSGRAVCRRSGCCAARCRPESASPCFGGFAVRSILASVSFWFSRA